MNFIKPQATKTWTEQNSHKRASGSRSIGSNFLGAYRQCIYVSDKWLACEKDSCSSWPPSEWTVKALPVTRFLRPAWNIYAKGFDFGRTFEGRTCSITSCKSLLSNTPIQVVCPEPFLKGDIWTASSSSVNHALEMIYSIIIHLLTFPKSPRILDALYIPQVRTVALLEQRDFSFLQSTYP